LQIGYYLKTIWNSKNKDGKGHLLLSWN
jgi:hypothetical protein